MAERRYQNASLRIKIDVIISVCIDQLEFVSLQIFTYLGRAGVSIKLCL